VIRLVVAALFVLGLTLSPLYEHLSFAQPAPTVVARGLDAPRGLAFGPGGELYVAEAGRGGDERVEWVPPFGFGRVGTSGQISRVDGGQRRAVAAGLQSIALGPGSEVVGPAGLALVGSQLYAVIGQGSPLPGSTTRSFLARIQSDGSLETVADLGAFERANDPDQIGPDSNPFDLTAGPDGALYVVDAGANALLRVTSDGQISVVTTWTANPVPTGVAFDSRGRAYVSFLSQFPFARGTARIDRVVDGRAEVFAPNLTQVVDVLVGPDDSVYALELTEEFALTPPPPRRREQTGRILRFSPSGTMSVVHTGLNYPTKMAWGPDGSIYVSNNATFLPPGSGEIVRVSPTGAAAPSAPAPATPSSTVGTPAQPPAAARPAQVPATLPRTGVGGGPPAAVLVGLALALVGFRLRGRSTPG
jgi:glucose/arabinose dehydrogenase